MQIKRGTIGANNLVVRSHVEINMRVITRRLGAHAVEFLHADMNFLAAFLFNPISRLANPRLCHGLEIDEEGLELAFTMAWDAIKL